MMGATAEEEGEEVVVIVVVKMTRSTIAALLGYVGAPGSIAKQICLVSRS